MDKDQMPRMQMEKPTLVDRDALSGRIEWQREKIRRWLPPAIRRHTHPVTRTRTESAPPRAYRRKMVHGDPNPPRSWTSTLGWQVSACMLICLLIIGMKMMDVPMVNSVLEGLDYAVNTPTDFDSLGKLKFIDSLMDKTAAVFNNAEEAEFTWPVKGEVVAAFDEQDSDRQGIDIAGTGTVTAAMDGQVFYVGENSRWGTYIRMRHADGWDTIYGHVTPSVKTGQDILAGEALGQCIDGEDVHFEIWRDSVPVDPVPMLPATKS